MTGMWNDVPVVTVRTFKLIKTKITCMTKKGTFNIVEEDVLDGMNKIEVFNLRTIKGFFP